MVINPTSILTKRHYHKWFSKGRKTTYDLTNIKHIRNGIKLINHKINSKQSIINTLNYCTESEKQLIEITNEIKQLQDSISYDNHEAFLKNWAIVGRANYGINMKAMQLSRGKINEIITQEFFCLASLANKQIIELETRVMQLQPKVELEKIENQKKILIYQNEINQLLSLLHDLNINLQKEVAPLKEYLQNTANN